MSREQLITEPLEGYPPLIVHGLWQMQDARRRTLRWLDKLDPKWLDWSPPGEQVNTVGTLLYHIAAIEIDWIFTDAVQTGWPPALEPLMPYEVRDEAGRLTPVIGETLAQHLDRLSATRHIVLDAMLGMTDADFLTPRALPDYDVTPAWVLHHLCQHEAEHRGEIMTLIARAR